MVVAGIVLLLLCGAILLARRSQEHRLLAIRTAETSTAKELSDAASYVADRLGEAGSFSQIANVNGTVKCESPLVSEVAQHPCVFYEMKVTREYEVPRGSRMRSRRRTRRPSRRSETVASNRQRIPFWIEDATGRIRVDPERAEIDAVKMVDRFEPVLPTGGATLRVGDSSIDLGVLPSSPGWGSRTLGYHIEERLLPLDRRAFVLGEARDDSGELTIRRPRDHEEKFIISLNSRDEMIGSTESAMKWLSIAAVTSGVAGAGLIAAGLLT